MNTTALSTWSARDATEKTLRKDEGYRRFPYRDSRGILTIGIGWNLEANGLPDDIIEELFRRGFEAAYQGARELCPNFDHLSGNRQLVLVAMVYQMGKWTVGGFKNFLRKLGEGDYRGAAAEMRDSRWYQQTQDRAERLARLMEGTKP
jgi:lysozyme